MYAVFPNLGHHSIYQQPYISVLCTDLIRYMDRVESIHRVTSKGLDLDSIVNSKDSGPNRSGHRGCNTDGGTRERHDARQGKTNESRSMDGFFWSWHT